MKVPRTAGSKAVWHIRVMWDVDVGRMVQPTGARGSGGHFVSA